MHGVEDNELFLLNGNVCTQINHCVQGYKEGLLSERCHEFGERILILYIHHHYQNKEFYFLI